MYKTLLLDINILVCFYLKHCTILLLRWWDFATNTRIKKIFQRHSTGFSLSQECHILATVFISFILQCVSGSSTLCYSFFLYPEVFSFCTGCDRCRITVFSFSVIEKPILQFEVNVCFSYKRGVSLL